MIRFGLDSFIGDTTYVFFSASHHESINNAEYSEDLDSEEIIEMTFSYFHIYTRVIYDKSEWAINSFKKYAENKYSGLGVVAHACNPSTLGGLG